MNITKFVEYLNESKKLNIDASYYVHIEEWKQWWKGYVESIHKVKELSSDGVVHTRQMASLRMPKQACEDWAAKLLNDKTTATIDDSKSAEWLLGNDDQTGGILRSIKFWKNANNLVELAFRSGTGAFVMSVEGMQSVEGSVVASPDASIEMDYLPAECILPITVRRGKVVDCAFASEVTMDGKACVYLQTHKLEQTGYRITNEYFISKNSDAEDPAYEPAALPSGMAASISTGSSIPWFAILHPAACKNISGGPGLGMAVFSEAVDAARQVDLAFDNYCQDIYLGGKKVFYNKRLTRSFVDKDGEEHFISPDAMRQQQFFLLPEGDNPDNPADWHEYNPDLRVEDNRQAVQDALDYFSFKCGLGTRHYQFQDGGVKTATEYTGNRQDMVQHANQHQIIIEDALIQIFRAMLWAGKNILAAGVNPDASITINFDDSYIIDTESRMARMKDDATQGFIPRYKYLMERYGYDEKTAKQYVAEASAESQQEPSLSFGAE